MQDEVVDQGLSSEADRLGQVQEMLTGGKVPPEEANYIPAKEGSTERCGQCSNYEMPERPESTCLVVAGEVRAEGVCDMFEPAMDGQGQPGTAAEGMMNELPENSINGL